MCEATHNTRRLLVFGSVAELRSGTKHCNLNNGQTHLHVIKAENIRHEIVIVRGTVRTYSQRKQIDFTSRGIRGYTWDVDFQALGQQTSRDEAETSIRTVHSKTEDIIADLEYSFDDPFEAEPDPITLTIRVNL